MNHRTTIDDYARAEATASIHQSYTFLVSFLASVHEVPVTETDSPSTSVLSHEKGGTNILPIPI